MAVAVAGDNRRIVRLGIRPLIAAPPQSSGKLLLNQILYETAHPPAKGRFNRVKLGRACKQRHVR